MIKDYIWHSGAYGHAFESRTQLFFIFQLESISRSNLNFSTSYGRSIDLKSLFGLFSVSFLWLSEKILLKYVLIGGGTFVLPCPNGVDIAYVQTGNINWLD